jgi:hypothetical protein
MNMATSTPWGQSDYSKKYAPGIIEYSTPSHGGFHVAGKKLTKMPPALRSIAYPRDGWFEQDTAWCAVPLAFPQFFAYQTNVRAKELLRRVYPQVYEEIFKDEKVTNEPADQST